jgi:hypothetical protein
MTLSRVAAPPHDLADDRRRRRYADILADMEAQPNGSVRRRALQSLAEISRPLDRPLTRNERRVTLGSARETLADRALRYAEPTGAEGRDASGERVRDREPLLFDISGALVLGGQAVLLDEHLYIDDFRGMPFNWRAHGFPAMPLERIGFAGYDYQTEQCVVEEPAEIRALPPDRSYFLFNSYQARCNFGHMIHDLLAQIGAYKHVEAMLGEAPTPILVNDFSLPMQKFLFQTMIRPLSECVLTVWQAVRIPHGYTTDAMLASPRAELSCAAFRDLHARLQRVAADLGARDDYPRKIYVSRADSDKVDERSFANIAAVENEISRAGYAPVVVGKLAPAEILGMFHGAEAVVGVHGAGMLNPLFSARAPKVAELWGHPSSWNSVAMVDWACGLEHRVVRCDAPSTPGGRPVARIQDIRDAL